MFLGLILTPQKQQISLRSRPQRKQDCTTDVADPSSKTSTQTINVTLVTSFQSTSSTLQNYKESNYTQKFCDNRNNCNMFPTGTLPFQVSQQIKSGNSLLVSISTIKKFFRKISKKYSFKKKSNNQHESLKSPESSVNEFMESKTTNKITKVAKSQ